MSSQLTGERFHGSLLLELLHYAGWRLQISRTDGVSIRAVRDGVSVRAQGRTLAEATGRAFARAMRTGSARSQATTEQKVRA